MWQAFEREGEGKEGARQRAREEGGGERVPFLSPSRAPHALSRAQILPSPSPFNAGHTG